MTIDTAMAFVLVPFTSICTAVRIMPTFWFISTHISHSLVSPLFSKGCWHSNLSNRCYQRIVIDKDTPSTCTTRLVCCGIEIGIRAAIEITSTLLTSVPVTVILNRVKCDNVMVRPVFMEGKLKYYTQINYLQQHHQHHAMLVDD